MGGALAENFENRAALVGAEIARIDGRALDAMNLYEQAIRSAQANGFVHNEALAKELAARFYTACGFEQIAHTISAKRPGLLPALGRATERYDNSIDSYPWLRTGRPVAPGIRRGTIEAPVEYLDLADDDQSIASAIGRDGSGEAHRQTHARGSRARWCRARLLDCPRGDELRIQPRKRPQPRELVTVHLREGCRLQPRCRSRSFVM